MSQMMVMRMRMWMRYVYCKCLCVLVLCYLQGLLDEGDSSMDEGDSDSKVSALCFICAVLISVGWEW